MKLGFNLLLWTTHVTDEHWPIIERLKAVGYDGVEVPMFEGTPDHYEKLGRRLRDLGLGATGIGVMPGGGKSAVSPDLGERAGALSHLNWLTDCTAALGGTLAAGPFHQPLGEFSGRGATADEKSRVRDIHKQAAQYAAKHGVALSVEPLNRFECYFLNSAAQAAELVRAVDEPNYGYLYDTFHFNIEENSITEVIPATIKEINHVHISENNRGVPGAGHIDFQSVFNALKRAGYDGWMTIEAFGSALPDLAAATKIWRPLFASEAEVYEKGFRLMREGWDRAH
ncbi:isomerase [Devosia insulae DS-56]|uniref:Isomerase n=1 Tax=Devosia insulae DS-56 TaxID=1116389 RepID=A0A1E5XWM2_9HYPH|nr:sugar phosphate isomerase/epimerase [Devosia insulae]OEO32972.1 isomerase [Devosia insulae DS-56]